VPKDFTAVRVAGLRQYARSLKQVDGELPKALRTALNGVAEVVLDTAKIDVPQRSGRAVRSMQARSTRTEVRLQAGGPKAPHYPWLDFGGHVGRKKATYRPFLADGRYIYPAYYQHYDEIPDLLAKAFKQVAEAGGLEVE